MAAINNFQLELLSRPAIYPDGKTKLDYTESFAIGVPPIDALSYVFNNTRVDNVIVNMMYQFQPNLTDVEAFYSMMIDKDFRNLTSNKLMGRSDEAFYRLSDKFVNCQFKYLKIENQNAFLIRIEREDGLVVIIPSIVDTRADGSIALYLKEHAEERIICAIPRVFASNEIDWENFPYSANIIGIKSIHPNYREAYLMVSRSACKYATADDGFSNFTIYYDCNQEFTPFESEEIDIPGNTYKLEEITEAQAIELMEKFYGSQEVTLNGPESRIAKKSSNNINRTSIKK